MSSCTSIAVTLLVPASPSRVCCCVCRNATASFWRPCATSDSHRPCIASPLNSLLPEQCAGKSAIHVARTVELHIFRAEVAIPLAEHNLLRRQWCGSDTPASRTPF